MKENELVEKQSDGRWKVWMPVGEDNHWFYVQVAPEGIYIDWTLFPWEELDIARYNVRNKGNSE